MTSRYDLDLSEQAARRSQLLGRVAAEVDAPVAVAWIHPDAAVADLIRTLEVEAFPDLQAFISDEVEGCSRFVAVVDLTGDGPQLVHCLRVTSLRFGPPRADDAEVIGIPTLDEVVEANEDVTAADLHAYYDGTGIDLWRCVAVDTNFRVVAGTAPSGLRWSDIGYLRVFQEMASGEGELADRGVFAHVNSYSRGSLESIGLVLDPIAGRPELRTPAAEADTFDDRSVPVFIPASPGNVEVFRQIEAFAAPEVVIGPDA